MRAGSGRLDAAVLRLEDILQSYCELLRYAVAIHSNANPKRIPDRAIHIVPNVLCPIGRPSLAHWRSMNETFFALTLKPTFFFLRQC